MTLAAALEASIDPTVNLRPSKSPPAAARFRLRRFPATGHQATLMTHLAPQRRIAQTVAAASAA
jgi:hypothetical protein